MVGTKLLLFQLVHIELRSEPRDFKRRSSSSTLEVGRTVTQNFQLQVGEVSQSVTVSTANNC